MYDEVFQAVKALAISYASPDFMTIDVGSLPTEDSLSMYMGPGYPIKRYLDRGGTYRLPCVLNGKHIDQGMLVATMSRIHRKLDTSKTYPADEENGLWRITSIESSTPPHYLSQEESGQWLYGSILTATIYVKGV